MNLNLARYVDKWVGLPICLALFGFERLSSTWNGRRVAAMLATTPPDDATPSPPRRLLCMKFYGLGNMVILLPVLAALRRRYPEVEIDFMTMPGNAALLERSGLVTRVIPVDTGRLGSFLGSLYRALRLARSRRYDTVLDFEQFVKISCIIGYLSGARRRIGFNTDGQRRGFTYTTRVVYTDSDHMTAIFARLLRPLGVADMAPVPPWRGTSDEERKVDTFLREHGVESSVFPLVVMHLGIGMNFLRIPLKRWEPKNFAAVAQALITDHGAAVVFTGQGAEERQLLAEVRRAMRDPVLDATDRFSVTELVTLLRRAHLVVANDTSVMHLATLVATPVVGLFGPTAPLHYGPAGASNLVFYRDLYCSPCLTNYNLKMSRCVDPVCMQGIAPEVVLEGIRRRYLDPEAPLAGLFRNRPAR